MPGRPSPRSCASTSTRLTPRPPPLLPHSRSCAGRSSGPSSSRVSASSNRVRWIAALNGGAPRILSAGSLSPHQPRSPSRSAFSTRVSVRRRARTRPRCALARLSSTASTRPCLPGANATPTIHGCRKRSTAPWRGLGTIAARATARHGFPTQPSVSFTSAMATRHGRTRRRTGTAGIGAVAAGDVAEAGLDHPPRRASWRTTPSAPSAP